MVYSAPVDQSLQNPIKKGMVTLSVSYNMAFPPLNSAGFSLIN